MRLTTHNSLAALALSACLTAAAAYAAQDSAASPLPRGVTAEKVTDDLQIRILLARTSCTAVSENGLKETIKRLSSPDRKRFGEFFNHDFKELNGRIDQIERAFKAKYDKSLDLDNDKLLSGFIAIHQAEISDETTLRQNWPVPPTPSTPLAAVAPNTPESIALLDNGKHLAVVRLPASHNLPAIDLSLLREGLDWRIDLSDDISAQQFYDNMKNALTEIGESSDRWPADINDTYRMIAHRLLVAVSNVNPNAPTDKSRASTLDPR